MDLEKLSSKTYKLFFIKINMKKALIFALSVLIFVSILGFILAENSTISNTGEIKYLDLEKGCWIIETSDNIQYEPLNLNEEFQEDGLEIEFEAEIVENAVSICQIGTLIEISDIEIIIEKENEIDEDETNDGIPKWAREQIQEGTIGVGTHTKIRERLQLHLNSTECPENCTCAGSTIKCELNGQRTMTILAGNSGNKIVQVKGINASTNVTLYKSNGKIYGEFNNETKRIHDPEQIQSKINARIRAKIEEYNITLDEDGYYRVQTKKKARLFLIVPVREKVKAQVDAETGEIIRVRNPWWGFLARDIREESLLGANCGTVSPDYINECCQNKGYDLWNSEIQECVFSE